MADEIDRAQEAQDNFTYSAIESAKARSGERDAPETGFCLYCGERVETPRRWCDAECRDGWEVEHIRRRI